jgi:two-component system CheB/CheR fusion protein
LSKASWANRTAALLKPTAVQHTQPKRVRTGTPRGGTAEARPCFIFFQSLAADQKGLAIGVVLSGTASDGALGLKAIKGEGGITFAQDEKSAKFGGMPHSAAAGGAADFVLPPEGIAQELVRIARRPFPLLRTAAARKLEGAQTPRLPNGGELGAIFSLLRAATGVDYSLYKTATPRRRILRRMALARVATVKDYVRYLKDRPDEVQALQNDLLILVTSFFRDPETYAALEKRVFPAIARDRRPQAGPLRIWVPGCSTGEEAYSLAIAPGVPRQESRGGPDPDLRHGRLRGRRREGPGR